MQAALLAVCACVGSGCFGNTSSPFPPGLDPLEDNRAEPPVPTADDPYPERLEAVYGDDLDYAWGHARGYIRQPAAVVWDAIHDPVVVADRRSTDGQEFTLDVEPEYSFSFQIHYTVDEIVNIEWDEVWRFGSTGAADSFLGLARFQKIYGTEFIEVLEGSVTVLYADDGVTEVQFIEHLEALQTGPGTIETYFDDLYASIRARAYGEPLPEY